MAEPQASVPQHRFFWAGEDAPEERTSLIAEIAANIREDAAPEPDAADAAYESKARGCELLIGEFVGSRGLIDSAGAGSAKVDFATYEEALKVARSVMGTFVVPEKTEGGNSSTGYIGSFPFTRG